MKELETEQLSNLAIYFPDILDGSTIIGDTAGPHSYHKDVIDTEDENLNYKVKVFFGVNKVIELANVFKRVYLDKHEFLFIVKELFARYPSVCLELLKAGKISFVNNDKFFMFYDLRDANSFIQIHRVPKPSNEKIIEELGSELNKAAQEAVKFSLTKSISHVEPDPEFITNKFFDDLKRGYYQALAVGINSIIGVDNENKQLFDLIAQSTINMYICDLLGIEAIYLKEYSYCTEKYKNQFKNSISIKRTRFGKISINDYTTVLALAENYMMSNEQLSFKAHKNIKKIEYIGYLDEYVFLKYSFSCDIKRDYAGKKIVFVKKDGEMFNYHYCHLKII